MLDEPRSITLRIPARLDCIELVGEALRALGPTCGLSEAESYRIELGVVEALNNVVEHAMDQMQDRSIDTTLCMRSDRLEIIISDGGTPRPSGLEPTYDFDPEVPASWPEGGMGLYIIHEVMDDVAYMRDGDQNRLTLTKHL